MGLGHLQLQRLGPGGRVAHPDQLEEGEQAILGSSTQQPPTPAPVAAPHLIIEHVVHCVDDLIGWAG